ncbi:hypothetical protein PACTADRAFT_67363 [Pachysolen tannophilus NRRL Y-2460]|uniref:CWH43-like N-terminal domain-containing protein n=1 Tax=Pachysolen tannophilus NRRL Y-2460 TaxID=669874 RepID=A0A1E4TWL7_PACTA|nr:hypothetical protein PACTADRAFT_67363 [Pachysolen tannophilus NRRL Y-2460]
MRFLSLFQYWQLPLLALISWYGMLIAMLACWSFQGHPIYWFMTGYQDPVYLSDIGATSLQPLFIACAGFQGLFYFITFVCEFFLRLNKKLIPGFYNKDEKNLSFAAIIFAAIGQLGILMVSIFNTHNFSRVHVIMLCVFIVGVFACMVCNIGEYGVSGNGYGYGGNNHLFIFGMDKLVISFFGKLIWIIIAIVFAVVFAVDMKSSSDEEWGISASFEWTLCFWYGILHSLLAIDLSCTRHAGYDHHHYYEKEGDDDRHTINDSNHTNNTISAATATATDYTETPVLPS